MFAKRRSESGSVSVFLIMILAFIFAFVALFIDYARIAAMKAQSERLAHAAVRSVMSSYDPELQEKYGLFAYGEQSGDQIMAGVLNSSMEKGQRSDGFDVLPIELDSSGRTKAEQLTIPNREQFKLLYVLLMRLAAEPIREQEALARLSQQSSSSLRMVTMMMDVFEELSFIERRDGHIVMIPKPPKRELSSSLHFSRLGSLAEMEQHLLYASTSQCTRWFISRLEGAS